MILPRAKYCGGKHKRYFAHRPSRNEGNEAYGSHNSSQPRIYLALDADWTTACEKESNLPQLLTAQLPFICASRHVLVSSITAYPESPILYEGVAIAVEK